jgi:hypothetical protein
LIHEKIALDGLTNVQVMPFALGDKDEGLDYHASGTSGWGTFLPQAGRDKPIKVAVKRGDDVLDRIDILKVDVEGFEPFVFRGLQNRINADRPVILTELGERCREGFGDEQAFRRAFYDNAEFFEVTGRNGRKGKLRPFDYNTSNQVMIVPRAD